MREVAWGGLRAGERLIVAQSQSAGLRFQAGRAEEDCWGMRSGRIPGLRGEIWWPVGGVRRGDL